MTSGYFISIEPLGPVFSAYDCAYMVKAFGVYDAHELTRVFKEKKNARAYAKTLANEYGLHIHE